MLADVPGLITIKFLDQNAVSELLVKISPVGVEFVFHRSIVATVKFSACVLSKTRLNADVPLLALAQIVVVIPVPLVSVILSPQVRPPPPASAQVGTPPAKVKTCPTVPTARDDRTFVAEE